ncbi:ATP-binding protein [Rathayibacter sp. YIM 133350]|uniref:ATP-binding protein n=1 Tax=Rathayibacter sp. YIM 133350 TaxID=3131992 RepID=UPI00307F459D
MTDTLTLIDDASEPRPDPQFRLTRFQMVNWGTFSGYWDMPVSPDGHLITGESGKGKSTILDGFAAVLFAPKDLDFNAAARDATTKGRDRTLLTYVRGAYGNKPDDESDATTQYHRQKIATWSALSLEFTHPDKGVVNLIRIFRAAAGTEDVESLSKVAMILDHSYDLKDLEELVRIRLDSGVLKRKLNPVLVKSDFARYAERYRALLGIESEQTLALLQKIQAMKGLDSLDGLMREFMLDTPQTFVISDRAVTQFTDLKAAHTSVVTAKAQRDHLRPIVGIAKDREEAIEAIATLEKQSSAVERARIGRAVNLLTEGIRTAETEEATAKKDAKTAARLFEQYDTQVRGLQAAYDGAGGDQLKELDTLIDRAAREKSARSAACRTFHSTLAGLGLPLPSDADEHAAVVAAAQAELDGIDQQHKDSRGEAYSAHERVAKLGGELRNAERELASLQKRHSNIDDRDVDLRDVIARACDLDPSDLPFAAELMQVKGSESDWAGAIERVLRSFATSILVPSEHASKVSRYANGRHLGRDVFFISVHNRDVQERTDYSADSIIRKLDVADHRFRGWILDRLRSNLNYHCVDSVDELGGNRLAVTREGLESSPGDRFAKRDRHNINDRSRWVLGFENTSKRGLVEARVIELRGLLEKAVDARTLVEAEQEARRAREGKLRSVIAQDWADVDVLGAVDDMDSLTMTRDSILNDNTDLAAIAKQLDAVKKLSDKQAEAREEAAGIVAAATRDRERLAVSLAAEQRRLTGEPEADPETLAAIDARFAAEDCSDMDLLTDVARQIAAQITEDEDKARAKLTFTLAHMTKVFSKFLRDYPDVGADLDESIDSLPDFLALLDRIERDRLPEFEREFRRLMQEGPTRHLTDLIHRLEEERKLIDRRIEPINRALSETSFNRGTHLQIEVKKVTVEPLNEFKRMLHEFMQLSIRAAEDTAEERYEKLDQIIGKLSSEDREAVQWKQAALDVRKHVRFVANEYRGEEIIDVHTSGTGRSGGQRVKLVTFTLAAALKYQLSQPGSDKPLFAAVIIDEAFAKADHGFTEQSLEVFRTFGFQLILATPNKMLMTFQHYVGGVTIVDRSDMTNQSSVHHISTDELPESA